MPARESFLSGKSSLRGRSHRSRIWMWWLIPKPFDLVSSLLYSGVLFPYLYSFASHSAYIPPINGWQVFSMVVIITILFAVDRIEYFFYGEQTPIRAAMLFLGTRILCIEIAGWLDQFRYSPFLYLVLPFLACLYFGDRMGYLLSLLAWIAYCVKHFYQNGSWLHDGTELHYLVLFTVGIMLSITIARVVTREKASRAHTEELLAELELSHQQLKAYSGQIAELATTRERNRLARDIHDTLGHYLTVINVQLEKALVFHDKRPLEALQAVSDAKRMAHEALQDVRRSVGSLRTSQDPPTFALSLAQLIERVQSENCALELHREGNEENFSKSGLLALYRAIQEGLTNIQKHAGASQIWIDLCFDEQEANLILRDNGRGFDRVSWEKTEPGPDGGYGLRGVQERLELVGGSFQIQSVPGQGTILGVTIPKYGSILAYELQNEGGKS